MKHIQQTMLVSVLFALPLVGGCGGEAKVPDDKAEKAAMIAKEVKASPDKYEEILKKYDLDADAFEALMYEVAEDPALSDKYATAMDK